MSGRKRVVVIVLAVLLVAAGFPGGAEAGSDSITNGLIIGGVTAGVVATVLIVAILVKGSEEPDFLELATRPPRAAGQRRVNLRCKPVDGSIPLVCW
jgi:Na+/glutamate symporter